MQVVNYKKVSELYNKVLNNKKLYEELTNVTKSKYDEIKKKYINDYQLNNDEFETLIVNVFETSELLDDSDDEIDKKPVKEDKLKKDELFDKSNKENYEDYGNFYNELQFQLDM